MQTNLGPFLSYTVAATSPACATHVHRRLTLVLICVEEGRLGLAVGVASASWSFACLPQSRRNPLAQTNNPRVMPLGSPSIEELISLTDCLRCPTSVAPAFYDEAALSVALRLSFS